MIAAIVPMVNAIMIVHGRIYFKKGVKLEEICFMFYSVQRAIAYNVSIYGQNVHIHLYYGMSPILVYSPSKPTPDPKFKESSGLFNRSNPFQVTCV